MRDILPPELFDQIARQYLRSVREAESGLQNYQADEDAITGALGGSMDRIVKGTYSDGKSHYV